MHFDKEISAETRINLASGVKYRLFKMATISMNFPVRKTELALLLQPATSCVRSRTEAVILNA